MHSSEAPALAESAPNRAHRVFFSVGIAWIARLLHLRDSTFGWVQCGRVVAGIQERSSRHAIPSRAHSLDAVFTEPTTVPPRAALLLCHGIGETVEQWFGVQQLLAEHGVASLVFDYSGYGRSTGQPDWEQFEADAIAAFHALQGLAPDLPHSVLGFSLGSGVATAIIHRLGAHRLILCAAFTCFRSAAIAIGVPRAFAGLVPPIWHAQPRLAACKLPVLIVHGEKDRLFSAAMARELADWCEPAADVVLVPGIKHNQPFRRPHLSYWGPIAEWLCK